MKIFFLFSCLVFLTTLQLDAQIRRTVPIAKPNVNTLTMQMERGKKVYSANCMTCHMADGYGAPRMNPPLANAKAIPGKKEPLIRIVLKGMKGKEIEGEYYQNTMEPHQHLSNRQIADVLTYIRNSFGNKASAVSEEEVKKLRNIRK